MEQMNRLRGAVVGKFGSMEKLAQKIGWSGRKTRDVVCGRQTMTVSDIEALTSALDVQDTNEFMRIFFSASVHLMDTEEVQHATGQLERIRPRGCAS